MDLQLEAPQQAFAPAPRGETPAARAGDARNNFAMNSATRSFWHRQSVAGVATPKRGSAAVLSRSRWQTSLCPWRLSKPRGMRLRICLWRPHWLWAGVILSIIPYRVAGIATQQQPVKGLGRSKVEPYGSLTQSFFHRSISRDFQFGASIASCPAEIPLVGLRRQDRAKAADSF